MHIPGFNWGKEDAHSMNSIRVANGIYVYMETFTDFNQEKYFIPHSYTYSYRVIPIIVQFARIITCNAPTQENLITIELTVILSSFGEKQLNKQKEDVCRHPLFILLNNDNIILIL